MASMDYVGIVYGKIRVVATAGLDHLVEQNLKSISLALHESSIPSSIKRQ